MAFGKRAPAGLVTVAAPEAAGRTCPTRAIAETWRAVRETLTPRASAKSPGASRRRIVATACFGLILGFGGVTAGTTFVQASERVGIFNFFQELFSAPLAPQQPKKAYRAKSRYAALPDSRRISAIRQRAYTPRPAIAIDFDAKPPRRARATRAERRELARPFGGEQRKPTPLAFAKASQSVCVRTCDGYLFPVGKLTSDKDLPVHKAACAAACPNAPTVLYRLTAGKTELDQAVSLEGSPYLASAWANVYRQKRVANCSCNPPGVAVIPMPIARDGTLRVGDVVATQDSADIVTRLADGDVTLTDYRSARALGRALRRDVERRVGTIRRENDEAKFRRMLRVRQAKATRVQIAELKVARMKIAEEPRSGTDAVTPIPEAKAGFTPVRVLVPSPYEP